MALESIRVPNSAISLEDDRFQTAAAARHIARSVAGTKLIIYPRGGHVFVGHATELFKEVAAFLTEIQATQNALPFM